MKYILGLILGLVATTSFAQPRNNNVLLIVADDLGYKDVGYNGGQWPTPNIDRLAKASEHFTRFYSWSTCAPSRHALFSGWQPGPTWSKNDTNDPGETLAEKLKDRGYQTAVFGKWQLGWSPTDNGFDTYFGPDVSESFRNFRRDTQTEILSAKAETWLKERDTSKPFFLAVTFTAVHSPIKVGNTYRDRANGSQFGGLVIALDDGVGRLLDAVDEDTIVMFVSDNGGNTELGSSNDPLRGGKHELFEGGVRVLSILRDRHDFWPDRPPNQALLGMQDIEELILSKVDRANGRSHDYIKWNLYGGKQKYYVDKRWKLIHKNNSKYLFDLKNDPKENTNLYNSKPNKVQEIEALFGPM